MPVYQTGIPTGTVNLDVDYLNLQGNFQQLNIVYGTDHYPFDNATPNQGFHNLVTTPPVVNNPPDGLPPATAANPKLYAFQQYGALGVLQYSRGPTNAVPTPLTNFNSPVTPVPLGPSPATINVIDFVGMAFAFCHIYALDIINPSQAVATVIWTGSQILITTLNSLSNLVTIASGSILQLKNTGPNPKSVFWSLQLIRVQ